MTNQPGITPEHWQLGDRKVQLRVSDLRGARTREEFDLHDLALEWGLSEPIVIHDESDIKAKASWKDTLEPFEHQVQNLITFCRRLPVSIIADDVGLGKTISAGLILSELIVRRKVNRCLVVCTKLIAPQWIEELHNKFRIDGHWATGSAVRVLFRGDATVVATSYEAARDYMSEARNAGFDMLILDEAHKLRNLYGTQSPPKMAKVMRQTLEDRVFKYVLMLTATPMQNRIWDLYSLIDCLAVAKGHANPFGDQASFGARYGNALKYPGWSSTQAGMQFRDTLRQYLVRTRRATVRLAFPKRVLELWRVPATKFDRQLIAVVANALDGSVRGKGLLSASLGVAMMSSPHALRQQLHNMAEREPDWQSVAREVDAIVDQYKTPSKLEALVQICRNLSEERPSDWRVVVFTCRVETLDLIVRRLSELGIAVGIIRGGQSNRNQQAIQEFSSDPPGIHVLASTDTGAEGVNLQAGNVMVNYDLPWNPMIVEQRIGRVQRLGSKFKNVVIFNLAVADSPEDRVVARLLQKLIEISESVGDIESILEAASERSAGGKSIEDQIAEMVRKSLMGQDVEQQRLLAEKSIINAKRQLEENEQEINEQLGDLSELHRSGARPPDLFQNVPSRPVREFVVEALRRMGHSIQPRPEYGEDVFAVRYAGERSDLLVALDRHTWKELKLQLPGHRLELFQPGQPGFERLLQTWRESAASHVVSLSDQTETMASAVLQNWLQQIQGATLAGVRITNRQPSFAGQIRSLVRASNGVDQYEKLLHTRYRETKHEELLCQTEDAPGRFPRPSFDLSKQTRILESVKGSVQQDGDIARFTEFYVKRLQEELPKAGESPIRRKKLADDFTVALEAGTVSAEGFEYEVCDADVSILVDGSAKYQLKFQIVPASGQFLHEPAIWEFCERTGAEFPTEFMASCDYSGVRVVRHCLVKSDESARNVLPDYLEICQRTGKHAVIDEFACSSLSGIRAVLSELHQSEISTRLYFTEEMDRCEFSSTSAGVDELKVSEISQRKYRADQSTRCCVSGLEGHQSEFTICEVSGEPVCSQELGTSSVSGKRVAKTLLHPSERDPSRVGLQSEFVTCEVSGRRVLIDEAAKCSITGMIVDTSLLTTCPETGEQLLCDRLETCEVSGIRCSPHAMTTCAVTNRRVLKRLCSESAVSGQLALSDQCKKCEITGAVVLPGELTTSDCSGLSFRNDEASVSEVSGRTGHRSEIVECAVSGKMQLQDEVSSSELSGRKANSALLVKCASTGKLVLPSELEHCEFTGVFVIPDELFVSDFSGKKSLCKERVASELSGKQGHSSEFGNCELTWQYVLLSELVECSVTGKKVLESECIRSAVSGSFAIASLGVRCECTDAVVLPSEIAKSDVSGKRFRKDQSVRSEKSGRIGHQSETVQCEVSGQTLLKDEVAASELSGLVVDKDLLRTCSVTGTQALRGELEQSEFSDNLAVPDQMIVSDVSARKYCSNEGVISQLSGQRGHCSEAGVCDLTGKKVLQNELVECEITHVKVLPSKCDTSDVSGRHGVKHLFLRCDFSGIKMLPDEAIRSNVSRKQFSKADSVVSDISKRVGHPSEAVSCEYTGRKLLIDEAGVSDFTGKTTVLADLQDSVESRRRGRPDEFVACAVTKHRLLKDEVEKSVVSGLVASRKLFSASDLSDRRALITELFTCPRTGLHLLPNETAVCSVSGLRVDRRTLEQSAFSDELALPEWMKLCADTIRIGVPADGAECEETGQWMCHQSLRKCTVTGRRVQWSSCVQSSVSGRWMLQSAARKSFKTERWLHPDEATLCCWNSRYLETDQARTCRRTNLSFDASLIDASVQFKYLTPLMQNELTTEDGQQFVTALKPLRPDEFKRLKSLTFIRRNAKLTLLFFRAVIETRFRMDVHYVLFVARVKEGQFKIISPLTQQLKDGTWKPYE